MDTITEPTQAYDIAHERVPLRDLAALLPEHVLVDVVRVTNFVPDGPRRIETREYFLSIEDAVFETLTQYPTIPKAGEAPETPPLIGQAMMEQMMQAKGALEARAQALSERAAMCRQSSEALQATRPDLAAELAFEAKRLEQDAGVCQATAAMLEVE